MKVIVVGGGIGGLATALSLHGQGLDCVVYEQSRDMHELGVGLNILPPAVAVLAELGLMQQLDTVGIRTSELILMDRRGNRIWTELRGIDAGHALPQFAIHRGQLQRILYEAVLERLGPERVQVDRRLIAHAQDDDGVEALFVDSAGEVVRTVRADALIAADGLHSRVRAFANQTEGPPRWNGVMIWRGATDWPKFLTGRSMIVAGGVGCKLVVYPIGRGATTDAQLTNWAVCARIAAPGASPPRRENWSRLADRGELQPHLDRFGLAEIDLSGLVAATGEVFEFPMCDRDPLTAWSCGCVTLLGDAAHPMLPMGSNGATQAILDARAVASSLATNRDVSFALHHYEMARRPLTAEIVQLNRRGGPEAIIDVVEERAPEGFASLDQVISASEIAAVLNQYAVAARSTPTGIARGMSCSGQ